MLKVAKLARLEGYASGFALGANPVGLMTGVPYAMVVAGGNEAPGSDFPAG